MRLFLYIIIVTNIGFSQSMWMPTNGPNAMPGHGRILTVSRTGSIVVGTSHGIYVSTDKGATWQKKQIDWMHTQENFLTVKACSNGAVYAFSFDHNDTLFSSTDNGTTWTIVKYPHMLGPIWDILTTSSGHIFVASEVGGIARSTDNGLTWIVKDSGLTSLVTLSIVDASSRLFTAALDGDTARIYFSSDNGDTWTQSSTLNILRDTPFGIYKGRFNKLFAVGDDTSGIYYSNDLGITWIRSSDNINTGGITLVNNTEGTLFLGGRLGVLRSSDNGDTWTSYGQGVGSGGIAIDLDGYLYTYGLYKDIIYRTKSSTLAPDPPMNLLGVDSTMNSVTLQWNPNVERDLLRYRIFRGIGPDTLTLYDSVNAGINTYTDLHAIQDSTLYYKISAVDNRYYESDYSNTVRATPRRYTTYMTLDNGEIGAFAWGDYNGDGYMDLSSTGLTKGNVPISIIYRNDSLKLTDIRASLLGLLGGSTSWTDINNDDRLDLIVSGAATRRSEGNRLSMQQPKDGDYQSRIYRNDRGNFTDLGISFNYGEASWGDFDNDGRQDLLLGDTLYNNEHGTFTPAKCTIIPPTRYWGGAFIDYDKDGDFDILTTQGRTDLSAIILRNDGPGIDGTWRFTKVQLPFNGTECIRTCDYDNDGYIDVLVFNTYSSILKLFKNVAGTFNPVSLPTDSMTENSIYDARWGDIDNDGNSEIILCAPPISTYDYYVKILKYVSGSFKFLQGEWTLNWFYSLQLGDFDSDGDLDIVASEFPARIYRNNTTLKLFNRYTIPLQAEVLKNSVKLSWSRSRVGSPFNTTFNFYVGTIPGNADVVSCQSDLVTGKRHIARMGNAECDTFFILRNLKPGTYYWNVQTVLPNFVGTKWLTPDYSFTIQSPAIPKLITPGAADTNQPILQSFRWSSSSTATLYRVQISRNDYFSTLLIDSTISDTIFIQQLENESTYYWRISALNALNQSDWSTIYSFKVAVHPSIPELVYPLDNMQNLPIRPTLGWQTRTVADTFELRLSTDSLFSNVVFYNGSVTSNYIQASTLNFSTIYFWQVRARNRGGVSSWSTVRSFSTVNQQSDGWLVQSSGTVNHLYSVDLEPDGSRGCAVGGKGTILLTSDGGRSWVSQSQRTLGDLFSVAIPDSSLMITVGAQGTILRSTDMGTFWLPESSGTNEDLYGVFFVDKQNGTIVGNDGIILHTTDGGIHWHSQPHDVSPNLRAVFFTGINFGTAVATDGSILRTFDGNQWGKLQYRAPGSLYAVYFFDPNNGMVAGSGGTIINTTNGGINWSSQAAPVTKNLLSVTFAERNNGFIVGSEGTILSTTNGGLLWGCESSPILNRLNWVSCLDATHAVIVGDWGTILRTETGGVTSVRVPGISPTTPKEFRLSQNYPNPFNPSTIISFDIPKTSNVVLQIYDVLGREITTLINNVKTPGTYIVNWEAFGVPSGVYFYRLTADVFTETKKLLLLR